jgi:L-2,4-diaminobutyric acid acetyltransferase
MTATTRQTGSSIALRPPRKADGAAIHALVDACKPLDLNSLYLYLLIGEHFSATSVVGEKDGNIVSLISAYVLPEKPDTIFVWQVAVGEAARGQGIAKRMLHEIVSRPACRSVRFMETTITPSNEASQALFRSFARDMQAPVDETVLFAPEDFGAGNHEQENLFRIGPFANPTTRSS